MSAAPMDHPILGALFGDAEIQGFLTAEAELDACIRFEAALAQAEAAEGVIPPEAAIAIARLCAEFRPDQARLANSVAQDGVIIPDLVAQLREALGPDYAPALHIGATSQDVIDSALILRLQKILAVMEERLLRIIAVIDQIAERDHAIVLMGRTRMQRAKPIRVPHKLATWRDPLVRYRDRLDSLRSSCLTLQFGGAVGQREGLGDRADAVATRLALLLGLEPSDRAWHTERDRIIEIGHWFCLISGSLGKIGQDLALLAQNEIAEIKLAGGGRSSAMPHKANPVAAEILVALARFNASLMGGLEQAMIHENERSGAAWALEWLTLPQIAVTAGAGLRLAEAALAGLRFVQL